MVRRLKNFYHFFQAVLAVLYYRYPASSLKVIGVTGTDGKTTTVHLIAQILREANLKTAYISTVGAKIQDSEIDTGFHVTTPNPWALQKLLRKMVDKHLEYLVLEATSHGLDQHRLFGCRFQIGVLTNVTHEHLDYHRTFQKYLEAKMKLFKRVKKAILNKDDPSFSQFKREVEKGGGEVISYGLKDGDFTPKTFPFKTNLEGEYNLSNCLAAIAVAKSLKIEDEVIRKGLLGFTGITGRLEEINEGQNFKIFVDFAHTPNSLLKTLEALREKKGKSQRLMVVFGCAGLRDRQKRPLMGKIATDLADLVILTAEDPRTEDLSQIIEEISKGCPDFKNLYKIPDRKEAIEFALKEAKRGDLVVICGKGHEKSMCFGTKEIPWSDQEEVRKILRKR